MKSFRFPQSLNHKQSRFGASFGRWLAVLIGAVAMVFSFALPSNSSTLIQAEGAEPTFEWSAPLDQDAQQWVEDMRATAGLGEVDFHWALAAPSISVLENYLNCSNEILRNTEHGSELPTCDYSIAFCATDCSGVSFADSTETYSLYFLVDDRSDKELCYSWDPSPTPSNETWSCPRVLVETFGPVLEINPADFGFESAVTTSPSPESSASPEPSPNENQGETLISSAAEPRSFDSPSVFSELPSISPTRLAERVPFVAATSAVLVILVALPTQLINSTLAGSRGPIRAWFGTLGARIRGLLNTSRGLPKTFNKYLEGALGFLLASIIAGFADPSFGLNGQSLRVLITTFIAFLVVNLASTVLVRTIYRRRVSLQLPNIRTHYGYLALLLVTVVLSRLIQLEPAMVFGAVLTIEFARVIAASKDDSQTLRARLLFSSFLLSIGLGLIAWLTYSVLFAPGSGLLASQAEELVALKETLATIAIQSVVAMPILLIPVSFLNGGIIFRWSKSRWLLAFVSSVAMFVFMLIPLEESWGQAGSVTPWLF
jgi:hypothetical protein